MSRLFRFAHMIRDRIMYAISRISSLSKKPYPNELYIVLSNLLFHDGENFVPQSSVEIGMMINTFGHRFNREIKAVLKNKGRIIRIIQFKSRFHVNVIRKDNSKSSKATLFSVF